MQDFMDLTIGWSLLSRFYSTTYKPKPKNIVYLHPKTWAGWLDPNPKPKNKEYRYPKRRDQIDFHIGGSLQLEGSYRGAVILEVGQSSGGQLSERHRIT